MATERPSRRGAAAARSPWRQLLESYFLHHRKTAHDSALRLWRSPIASLMTWLVMGIALALPVGLLLLLSSLQGVSAGWESTARVTLYMEQGASTEQLDRLRVQVASRKDVTDVAVITREEALAEFRASSGLADALDYLDENPLPHTLLLTPSPEVRNTQGMQRLVDSLESLDSVARVQVDLGWLQRLNTITDLLGRGVWALGLLLAAAVILVIGNTIRLAIENRRDEILVAKLVGGTDTFVRRPFLYTGIWYGLGGGIVAFLLLQATLWWMSGPVERLASLYRSQFELTGLSWDGTLALLIIAVALGWLGAWLAVKRHLDAIEPSQIEASR
ncbi:permease-like cell division protein FtsX [Marinobacter nanhaiticus D15-8W]|uniref:Cell division protein FtsX n=1 Tax=Marinobacter nanhaiticus D15-8W TaxID=626887 RepID=N6X300_9GAMM|nr:permease-like cell division protein FtsX [Marinobacter nanhaiticus]ENO15463.1 cell division protein FtsX [Marinobacter nanhaiticus D15-8W]BES73687.1 permease-like cell division protein FtsX [Marinobacter nanhaiticus D15-8W]